MKVLWVTKGLGRGGAEQLVKLCTAHLQREGIDVEIAYVLAHKAALVADIGAAGIRVHCLAGKTRISWIQNLRTLIRYGNYDVVHTHSPLAAAASRLAAPGAKAVFIHTEHNVWQRYRRSTYVLNALTYGKNALALAVSEGVAASIVQPHWAPWINMPPVQVLHHGLDNEAVRYGVEARSFARTTLGLDGSGLIIGSVANFTPKKSLHTLLNAFARLTVGQPHAKLVLVGDGPLRPQLEARSSDLDLRGRVLFTGSRDDVQDIIPAFDVFALPSLHEGLSIALLEAMAAGIPPVVTPVGGLPEIITHDVDGIFVPTHDAKALSDAIEQLLQNERLRARIGTAARSRAEAFSVRNAAKEMADYYKAFARSPLTGANRS